MTANQYLVLKEKNLRISNTFTSGLQNACGASKSKAWQKDRHTKWSLCGDLLHWRHINQLTVSWLLHHLSVPVFRYPNISERYKQILPLLLCTSPWKILSKILKAWIHYTTVHAIYGQLCIHIFIIFFLTFKQWLFDTLTCNVDWIPLLAARAEGTSPGKA